MAQLMKYGIMMRRIILIISYIDILFIADIIHLP